jgi:hypothetical protein
MARQKPREQRRMIWLNRMEWLAFVACLFVGAVLIWLFATVTP